MRYVVAAQIHWETISEEYAAELSAEEKVHARQHVEQKKILSAHRKVSSFT